MRYLLLSLVFAVPSWAFEGLPSLHVPLTLVVDSERPIAPEALRELQVELALLMRQANRPVEWKLLSDMKPGDSAADLVMVKFRGACRMELNPMLLDERGTLAFTHTTDGEVLPFSEVSCENVKVATRQAMHGGQVAQGDQLLGRALARVVAHELWHMTSKQRQHAKSGVARHALSGSQLIADQLRFDSHDAAQLKRTTTR